MSLIPQPTNLNTHHFNLLGEVKAKFVDLRLCANLLKLLGDSWNQLVNCPRHTLVTLGQLFSKFFLLTHLRRDFLKHPVQLLPSLLFVRGVLMEGLCHLVDRKSLSGQFILMVTQSEFA